MTMLVEPPRPTGTSYFTCSEGHRFSLPIITWESTIFLHYFKSQRERFACPVCWGGGHKLPGYEIFTKKPKTVTLLPENTRVDWVHRGQHYDCGLCTYISQSHD